MKKRTEEVSKKNSLIVKTILYSGIIILISALGYLIGNLDKADSIISIWLPFMMAGTLPVFFSSIFITVKGRKEK
jgi:hypothetical protein